MEVGKNYGFNCAVFFQGSQDSLPEEILDKISSSLSHDWKRFGRLLGLSAHTIECVELENSTVHERCRNCLTKWFQQSPCVSWLQLKVILQNIDRNDIAVECEQLLQNIGKVFS